MFMRTPNLFHASRDYRLYCCISGPHGGLILAMLLHNGQTNKYFLTMHLLLIIWRVGHLQHGRLEVLDYTLQTGKYKLVH